MIDNFVADDCLPNRMTTTESPHLGTNPSSTGNYAKEYYIDYPSAAPLARMIMVDPGMNFQHGGLYDFTAGSPRYNWLSGAIDDARAQGIKWVIVANHYNYVSAGQKGNETDGTDYFNLLIAKKVDLILQGHDHSYQRSKQFAHSTGCTHMSTAAANLNCTVDDGSDDTYQKGKGPVLVIAGSGGRAFYTVDTSDSHAPYFAKLMGGGLNPTHGFTKFTVSESGLSASFTRASGGTFSDSFVITEPQQSDTIPPTAPNNLTAQATSSSTVDLSWGASTDNVSVTSYSVYRDGAVRASNVLSTAYTDNGLTPGQTYNYTVKAQDAAGNTSEPSNTASATTLDSSTTTLTFTPSNDATISKASPSTNYGSHARLLVDNSPVTHTLIKLPVTGVLDRTVTSAKLRMYVLDASNFGGAVRTLTSNNWTESTVKWNNAPKQNSTVVARITNVVAGTWVEFDLSSVIKGDGVYEFRIASSSSNGVDYASSQSLTNRPELILTID